MVMYRDRQQWPDAELVAAIAARDGQAFAVFYRRQLPVVVAFLLRHMGDRELAADLSAEVFAAVLLAAPRYRPDGPSATPWVLGIARNKLRMSLRRGRVEARARLRLGFEAVELSDDDLAQIAAFGADGEGRLRRLVEGLPTAEREAVRARVLDERTYADIAGRLRCSEMVIRKRVSRGLARMRDQLSEEGRREQLSG
jgi:RNA polymerase sigma-70 factor (ECF subfamily)